MPNGAKPPGDNSDKKPGASPKNDAGEPSRPTPPGPGRNDDRPRPPGGDRGPNLNAFRDKLGSRRPVGERFENLRRTHANLSILRRDGRPLADEPLARPPQDLKPVVQIVIGEDPAPLGNPPPPFAAALLVDGTVAVWGSKTEALAAAPAGGSPIVRLAAGTDHLLALRADGTVSAWGANAKGQCDVPTDLGKVTRIAAGRGFSVALGADGAVFAWGDPEGAAVPADLGNEVAAIATGTLHTVALRRDGKVIAWGANVFGQSDVPPIEDATAVACTFAGGAALTREGRVIGWGTLEDAAPAAPPANPIVEIEGLGDVLLLRDETGRLHLHGLGGGAGSLLRQIPRQVSLAFSTQLGFLYKPATEAAPEPPPPVPATTATENPAAPPAPKPETEASVAIDDLQRKFEDAYLAQVSEPFQNSVDQLDSFYLGALAKHQSEAAESSRLEDAVAFRDETARIEAGEAMPETDDPALPAALLELRLTYRRELSRHEADRQVAEAGLLEKYDAALGAIQDKFTQEQKLDDALEVKAFREHRAPSDGAAEIEPKA